MSDEGFKRKYLENKCSYLPYIANPEDSLNTSSPFVFSEITGFRIEHDAECYRAEHYPGYPSRLSAIHAHDNLEDAVRLGERNGWPLSMIKKFRLKEDELTRVIRANIEIPQFAKMVYRVPVPGKEAKNCLWEDYWTGEGAVSMELNLESLKTEKFHSGLTWHFLIEGKLLLVE